MKKIRIKFVRTNKSTPTTTGVSPDQEKITNLVDRAADGDFEAFGDLYSIFLTRIYRYVFYQLKDKMTAEDITEEVFVKAWDSIDSCKGKGQTFSAWLYRIAHNQIVDNLRKQRKYVVAEVEIDREIREPELEIEAELEWQEILSATDYLPEQQKQVIILKFIEELDNSEIAEIMGKSQGAVRVLQMRALAALRQKLGGDK